MKDAVELLFLKLLKSDLACSVVIFPSSATGVGFAIAFYFASKKPLRFLITNFLG
tara:strand:- start:1079 stop:1243 length:165 start_codon:yes stop_codon:yes gene_type:complete